MKVDRVLMLRMEAIERQRSDVVSWLWMNWRDGDLCAPAEHYLSAGMVAPSLTKDALSLGLLTGELKPDAFGLIGTLELTAEGRYLVRRMRFHLSKSQPQRSEP